MLGGDDADARAAAIARIGDVIPPDGIGPVCDLLPRLPDAAQVQVLAAIARYPASRVRPAALNAAKSGSPDVRVAALRTLESVGDASTVAVSGRHRGHPRRRARCRMRPAARSAR